MKRLSSSTSFNWKMRINFIILRFELIYFAVSGLTWHLHLLATTSWINICPGDGHMMAAGGLDKNVKIFDRRESSIVKTFDDIHTGNILRKH